MEKLYLLKEKRKKKDTLEFIRTNEKRFRETLEKINTLNLKEVKEKDSNFRFFKELAQNEELFELVGVLEETKKRIKKYMWELEWIDERIEEYKRQRFIEEIYKEKISRLDIFLSSKEVDKYQYGFFYKLNNFFGNWKKELKNIEGVDFLVEEERDYVGTLLTKKIRDVLNFSDKEAFDLNQYLLILLDFNSNGSIYRALEFNVKEYLKGLTEHYDKEEIINLIKSHKSGNYNIKENIVEYIINILKEY